MDNKLDRILDFCPGSPPGSLPTLSRTKEVEDINKRLHRLEVLLLRTPLPDFQKFDHKISSIMTSFTLTSVNEPEIETTPEKSKTAMHTDDIAREINFDVDSDKNHAEDLEDRIEGGLLVEYNSCRMADDREIVEKSIAANSETMSTLCERDQLFVDIFMERMSAMVQENKFNT